MRKGLKENKKEENEEWKGNTGREEGQVDGEVSKGALGKGWKTRKAAGEVKRGREKGERMRGAGRHRLVVEGILGSAEVSS